MAAVGEIRENPGGRRLYLMEEAEQTHLGPLWSTIQLNGPWRGTRFGVPAKTLDEWELLATLPPDSYGDGAD